MRPFRTLLVANRGEIAVRVMRTAREMGLRTVAVHSDVDAHSMHVREADTAVHIGAAAPASSYLSIPSLIGAAHAAGADAVHPGYGFLSESPAFAQAVLDAGLVWVGPPPAVMARMGDKLCAREAAIRAGVPVVPGVESVDPAALRALGVPLLIKASGGGGGRGMRVVTDPAAIDTALAEARSEALAAFGDGTLYAERYLDRPRHVEVQILADQHGHVYAFGERECSIQRRHQKLVEESPCVALGEAGRGQLLDGAVALARSVGYVGAGTLEFLLDAQGAFQFLEMNTRLQVEHPVTELRFGRDLVRDQLRIAAGEVVDPPGVPLGHAFECRIVAEDPARGFLPSPGRITRVCWPEGPGVRVDAGVGEGDAVPVHYDPLLAKLIVHGPDREAARARLIGALTRLVVLGVAHTGELLLDVVQHPAFVAGALDTGFLPRHFADWAPPAVDAEAFVAAAGAAGRAPSGPAPLPSPWATVARWT